MICSQWNKPFSLEKPMFKRIKTDMINSIVLKYSLLRYTTQCTVQRIEKCPRWKGSPTPSAHGCPPRISFQTLNDSFSKLRLRESTFMLLSKNVKQRKQSRKRYPKLIG